MLGVRAFAGRVFTPDDDRPGAPPVAVLSHRVWQISYASDPAVVGSNFVIEGHPFTVIGVAPPGFFGETLQSDPPDIWLPIQQEPMIDGDANLLHQSSGAWLRMMGRLRPGASTAGMSARLTGVLRQWLQHDSGYPANWMADVIRTLPKQVINVVPAGAGVPQRAFPSYQPRAIACGHGACVRACTGDRSYLWRGSGVVCHAHRPRGSLARLRPQHERSLLFCPQRAVDLAGGAVGRFGRRRNHARAQPQQARASGFRISGSRARARRDAQPAHELHPGQARRALPRA